MTGRAPALRLLVLLALVLLQVGCYYGQAVIGHTRLLLAQQPLDAVIADPQTPDAVREQLLLTAELLPFAESELGLPAAGQYRTFVQLDRDAVVYNVVASPRFQLVPLQWCFPVAGCVSYRGYFSRTAAEQFAERLRQQGLDVHVSGAAAYSTLGWFRDPLPSTLINRPAADLAEVLFHELAHVRLYLPGDTTFNESFATFVGREGVRRWLAASGREELKAEWQHRLARQAEFVAFVLDWRTRMEQAYQTLAAEQGVSLPLSEDQTEPFERLREALWEAMRGHWLYTRPASAAGYDDFFLADANNARLNLVADYHGDLDAFRALLARHDGDLQAFYQAVEALAELPAEARRQALDALAEDAASGDQPEQHQ